MIKIFIAFAMDLILGDPPNSPHPVRLIGKLISYLENKFLPLKHKKFSGICLVLITISVSYIAALAISGINVILEIYLIYTVLAAGSLSGEAMNIFRLLKENNLDEARKRLGFIVSRDTEDLSEADIIRGTVETVSENIVDGIVSPLFYFFLGGVPLAMAYKAASTIDSMIGYRTEKYMRFGWAGARLDDVLNFIPARITGFVLIPVASLLCGKNFINSFLTVVRDRKNHDSPNSAHSEAGVAGALGLRLGGRNKYFGEFSDKPFIGKKLKEFEIYDIKNCIKIMYAVSFLALTSGVVISFIITF